MSTDPTPAMNKACAVPFLASFNWYALWLRARLAGRDDRHACLSATEQLGLPAREMATVTYRTGKEELSRSFSVPIAGGARAANHLDASGLRISLHDRWQHKLPQTLVTAYGSRPWFRLIFPDMGAAIEGIAEEGTPLLELNTALHTLIRKALFRGEEEATLALLHKEEERLRPLAGERRGGFSQQSTLLEALSLLGPETLFPLAFPE